MSAATEYLTRHWQSLTIPVVVFCVVMCAGWFARRMLFRTLRNWAGNRKNPFDPSFFEALYGPFLLWVLILSLHIATQWVDLPARYDALLAKAFLVLWILSITTVASKLAGSLVKHYGRGVSSALPVTSLTQSLARLGVALGGILILLDTLHISVTPILTALGVGGIAVALALQDTLTNLFAGFYVSLADQVRVGDYIRLETGDEGYVTDISWRSTTLRALSNNLIVVPNAKIAHVIVTNYHLPEKRMSALIRVGVSYDSDIDLVERVLLEEAMKGAGEIQGMLETPSPFVQFNPGFGESSIDFTVICQVAEFTDQYRVQHEMRKRIFKRFRQENIEIPYPVRTVRLKREH